MTHLQLRAAALEPTTANDRDRTIDLVWSTGAEVQRSSYIESLSMDAKHVRLGRLNNGAPVLDTHRRGSVRDVIGAVVPDTARIVGGHGLAKVRFSKRADVDSIWRDVRNGIVRSVSVGYVVHNWRIESAKDDQSERRIAVDWEPHEVSMVPIPADAGAATRERNDPLQLTVREHSMSIASEKYQSELGRLGINTGRGLIDAERSQLVTGAAYSLGLGHTRYDSTAFYAGARGLEEIARYCLRDDSARSSAELIQRALATSDFPQVLSSLAQEVVTAAYREVRLSHTTFARKVKASSHRLFSTVIAAGEALPKVEEGAPIPRRPAQGAQTPYLVDRYATLVDLTRPLLINRDLPLMAAALAQAAVSAAQTTRACVFGLLEENPGDWFSAANGNAASAAGGSTLTATTLQLARAAMRAQEPGSRLAYLAIGPALETAAEALFAGRMLPESDAPAALKNPVILVDEAIQDERFYGFSADRGALQYAFLEDSNDGLTVELQPGFDRDVISIKVAVDVGACLADFRQAFRLSVA